MFRNGMMGILIDWLYLVGTRIIIRIYYDARSPERQIYEYYNIRTVQEGRSLKELCDESQQK